MKKILAFIPTWVLYYTGDFISRYLFMGYFMWSFYLYNWCMIKSMEIQDWAGLKEPWQYSEEE